ncbi:MAG TPA: hypothetical protein PLQ93_02080 [Bacteroidia bacterium]|nr:hypothetical protein [Bacteroidia bacterium]
MRIVFILTLFISFYACDKGYDLRFTNYYLEPIDSVRIDPANIVFRNIEVKTTTEAQKIKKGDYTVNCVSKSKKHFNASFSIPGKGGGMRTIQIDGLGSIVVIEEN